MPYVISNSSGENIVIPDEELNQDFSIDLIGRNYPNYGSIVAETFVRLLDNFATPSTPPVRAVAGQIWYDKNFKQIRIYDGAGAWRPDGVLVSSTTPTNIHNQLTVGTTYFNNVTRQLFIHDGASFKQTGIPGEISSAFASNTALGNPSNYGTRLRNIYLQDTAGVPRAVMALVYTNSATSYLGGEKLLAIISAHDEFDADNVVSTTEGLSRNYYDQLTEVGGIGVTIIKGINLRADDNTKVAFSELADRASTSYAVNTGAFGSDGANISASNLYHKDASLVSNLDDAYSVGASSTVFTAGYFRDIYVGNGTEGRILPNGNSVVSIGAPTTPIDNIYVTDIVVEDSITFPNGGDIGSPSDYITNIYVDELTANVVNIDGYTMPITTGDEGDQMYLLASGEVIWDRRSSEIEEVTAGDGIIVSRLESSLINGVIGVDTITVTVGEGRGIVSNPGNVEVTLVDFDTDELSEGPINQYFTTARARSSLSATQGVIYNSSTGVIELEDGADSFVKVISAGTGISSTRSGSIVTLNVGAGPGIIVNTTQVKVDDAYVRTRLSAGDGIQYNDATGEISLDYTSDFENENLLTFVRTSGNQTIGGTKTFSTNSNFSGGITTNIIRHSGLTLVSPVSGGNVTIGTDGSITTQGEISGLSDARVKTNFRPIENPLEKVSKLHGKIYDRTDNKLVQAGLIAQDVFDVLPEAITVGKDDLMYINMAGPVALLVEAVKELKDQLDESKKVIAQLKRDLGK